MNVGAVGALRRVKSAISVARHILEHTKHSFLVGDQATQFAVQMGFQEESLTTSDSKKVWIKWNNEDHCQPNFWTVNNSYHYKTSYTLRNLESVVSIISK